MLRPFPCWIYYREDRVCIESLAVVHVRRGPAAWRAPNENGAFQTRPLDSRGRGGCRTRRESRAQGVGQHNLPRCGRVDLDGHGDAHSGYRDERLTQGDDDRKSRPEPCQISDRAHSAATMRAQHDALGKDVLAHLLEDEGAIEKEKVVAPKDSQRIDLVFTPDPAKRARRRKVHACLRLIRRMTQQTCMFELFSSPLSETLVLLSQRKQISVLDEQLVQTRRKGAKKSATSPSLPVQWILSPMKPTSAIETLGFHRSDSWPAGFYQGAAPGYKVCIIALNELARTRETLPLRLLGTGHTQMDALLEIGAMPPDDPDRPVLLALHPLYRAHRDGQASLWILAQSTCGPVRRYVSEGPTYSTTASD